MEEDRLLDDQLDAKFPVTKVTDKMKARKEREIFSNIINEK